jgi:hypothetical protein
MHQHLLHKSSVECTGGAVKITGKHMLHCICGNIDNAIYALAVGSYKNRSYPIYKVAVIGTSNPYL